MLKISPQTATFRIAACSDDSIFILVFDIYHLRHRRVIMIVLPNQRINFWLYEWGNFPVYTSLKFSNRYYFCSIDENQIEIKNLEQQVLISMDAIESCERYSFSQSRGAGSAVNLRLTLKKGYTVNKNGKSTHELYLVPVDVLSHRISYAEMDAVQETVLSFLDNRKVTIHENPYYRELQRQNRLEEFSEEKWQATTPPNEYTKFVTAKRAAWMVIVSVVFAVLAIMVTAAIIFNIIMPWFQGG